MVLPEKYEWNGSPSAMPICCFAPRSSNSMNGSPAISSLNRVQRWQRTQRSRSSSTCSETGTGLAKCRLLVGEPRLCGTVAHRLVLQRAFAALVADRAVQRVVGQQELEVADLGLLGDLGRHLRLDDHAGGDLERARRLRLGEPAAVAGVRHVNEALPAGADWLK